MLQENPDYNPCNVCKMDHDYQYLESVQAHRAIMLKDAARLDGRFSFRIWLKNLLVAPPATKNEYYLYAFMFAALSLLTILFLTSR